MKSKVLTTIIIFSPILIVLSFIANCVSVTWKPFLIAMIVLIGMGLIALLIFSILLLSAKKKEAQLYENIKKLNNTCKFRVVDQKITVDFYDDSIKSVAAAKYYNLDFAILREIAKKKTHYQFLRDAIAYNSLNYPNYLNKFNKLFPSNKKLLQKILYKTYKKGTPIMEIEITAAIHYTSPAGRNSYTFTKDFYLSSLIKPSESPSILKVQPSNNVSKRQEAPSSSHELKLTNEQIKEIRGGDQAKGQSDEINKVRAFYKDTIETYKEKTSEYEEKIKNYQSQVEELTQYKSLNYQLNYVTNQLNAYKRQLEEQNLVNKTVSILTAAISNNLTVEISYQDRNGKDTLRIIEPYSLSYDYPPYIWAFCRLDNAPRYFRSDRILSINLLNEKFEQRTAEELKCKSSTIRPIFPPQIPKEFISEKE
jgi:hypothetical protein